MKAKHVVIGVVIIGMATAGFFLMRYLWQQAKAKKAAADAAAAAAANQQVNTGNAGGVSNYFPPDGTKAVTYPLDALNYGAKSDLIASLQEALNRQYPMLGLAVDGIWGKNTHNALKARLLRGSITSQNDLITTIANLNKLYTESLSHAQASQGANVWKGMSIYANKTLVDLYKPDEKTKVASVPFGSKIGVINNAPVNNWFLAYNAGTKSWVTVKKADVSVR